MSVLSMEYNFSFANQTNLDISLLNSGFNGFIFSRDTNFFPKENLKTFFRESNSTEILFNEADHPVSADSKY